jgi:hypothetical protein
LMFSFFHGGIPGIPLATCLLCYEFLDLSDASMPLTYDENS